MSFADKVILGLGNVLIALGVVIAAWFIWAIGYSLYLAWQNGDSV